MITADSMAKIVTDYHVGVKRRVHEALNHVRVAIVDWIEQAIQGPLPDDWREQFRAVLEAQAAQGRRVLPECVDELEAWIEGWATEYGLLPAAATTRSEVGAGSSFDLSVFDGPQEFHTTPTLSHEEIMSLTTVTDTAGPLQLFPQQSYSDDQLTPEQLKHWQTFAEFVEFDLNRKEREAAEDAAQVAKGQAILVGLFTAMWEPADWGLTAYQIGTDPYNLWSYAGLLPFVPAGTKSIFRAADKGGELASAVSVSMNRQRTLTPVADIARPTYTKGHAGQPVVDHIKARAAKGHATDPSNLDIKPWEWNSRKGAYEGQLLEQRARYIESGLTPEQADQVLGAEWEWLQKDVLARPMDPRTLDTIPFPFESPP